MRATGAPLFRWTSGRHLRRHPVRTTLTLLAVALGVAVFVAVGLVNHSILAGLRRATARITGDASLVVTGDRSGLSAAQLEALRALPGVELAAPLFRQVAPLRAADGRRAHGLLLVLGLDLFEEALRHDAEARATVIDAPDPLVLIERPRTLVLTETLAKELGVADGIGRATITLSTPMGLRDFTVHGLLRGGPRTRDLGERVALMDVETAARDFGRPGRFDEVRVRLEDGASPDAVASAIRATLGEGYEVERPEARAEPVERVLATWQSGLALVALLTGLLGAFLAYQALSLSLAERRRELGILRALGVPRRTLVGLVVGEASLLGAVGGLLGLGLGVALAKGLLVATGAMLQSYVVYVDLREIFHDPVTLLSSVAVGLALTLVAALGPILAARRLSPLQAMARDLPAEAPRKRTKARLFAGVALLCAGCALLASPLARASENVAGAILATWLAGFLLLAPLTVAPLLRGVGALARALGMGTLELAMHGARGSPERATVTLNAAIVGCALVVSTAALARSFEGATLGFLRRSIPADLVVTCGTALYGPTSMPMARGLAEKLRALPSVDEVQGIRYLDARLGQARVSILSFDVQAWRKRGAGLRALEGDEAQIVEGLRRGEGVAVSENLARVFGVHAGATLALRTPRGVHGFAVLGVVADYSSPLGVVSMDRSLVRRFWDDTLVDQFHVFTSRGAEPSEVRARMEALAREHDLFVLTASEVRERIRKMLGEAFAIVRLQELIALVVTLLGFASLFSREVLRRRRELGLLRALGAGRRRIALLVVSEAGVLGLFGAVLGLGLGALLAVANVEALAVAQMGWRFPFVFPTSAAAMVMGAIVACAALAGVWPGLIAARASPSEALRDE